MTTHLLDTALLLTSRLDLTIVGKTTVVLMCGLAAMVLARRARASVRHLLIAATFGTVLVLPILGTAMPSVTVALPLSFINRVSGLAPGSTATPAAPPDDRASRVDVNEGSLKSLHTLVVVFRLMWAAGAILLLAALIIDLQCVRHLRRGGLPWLARREITRTLAIASGVHRSVEVLLHESISSPLTCGLLHPAILLPIDASEWDEGELSRALIHELEHVRRGDWATQIVARVVCACYWFHPLVWMAWARLRLEAERACDDAVVQSAESTDYAAQLVCLARRLSTARAVTSLAMASRSDLSARIGALLDRSQRRGRVSYATVTSVLSIACFTALIIAPVRASVFKKPSPSITLTGRQGAQDTPTVNGSGDRPLLAKPNAGRSTTRKAKASQMRKAVQAKAYPETPTPPLPPSLTVKVSREDRATGTGTISNSASVSATATNSSSSSSSSDNLRF